VAIVNLPLIKFFCTESLSAMDKWRGDVQNALRFFRLTPVKFILAFIPAPILPQTGNHRLLTRAKE
jgi:hypothetical protein